MDVAFDPTADGLAPLIIQNKSEPLLVDGVDHDGNGFANDRFIASLCGPEALRRPSRRGAADIDKNKLRSVSMSFGFEERIHFRPIAAEVLDAQRDSAEVKRLAEANYDHLAALFAGLFAACPKTAFFASAGNHSADVDQEGTRQVPASLNATNLCVVANLQPDGSLVPTSNHGSFVRIGGVGADTMTRVGGYSGTSAATQRVAALAARVLAQKPELERAELIAHLEKTAMPEVSPGVPRLIDPQRALATPGTRAKMARGPLTARCMRSSAG